MDNVEGAVRRVIAMASGPCPACGDRPEFHGEYTADGRYRVLAVCHESRAQHFFSELAVKARDGRAIDELIAWVRGLFKADALPDIRELLHYNRGELPA